MNKIKLFTVAGLLVMASSLLAPSVADAAIFSSGTNCQAANLSQAMKGIGWSQAGIKNNATIPLFVVCPLDWDDSNSTNPTSVFTMATFPGSTGTVACTARAQAWNGGAYTSSTFTIISGVGGVGANRGATFSVIITSPLTASNRTVVCALDPGEGIEYVRIR